MGHFKAPLLIFLGIADHVRQDGLPFPYGTLDLFQLSQQKVFPIYPWPVNGLRWVIGVNQAALIGQPTFERRLSIEGEDGKTALSIDLTLEHMKDAGAPLAASDSSRVSITAHAVEWTIVDFQVEGMIHEPGVYSLRLVTGDVEETIGRVHLVYAPAQAFTPSQIKAIESNPDSVKAVRISIECKHCHGKLEAYSALERRVSMESDGVLWQHELPDAFTCACGQTIQSLHYLRESLHWLVGRDSLHLSDAISYERRYAHSHIEQVVDEFRALVASATLEKPIQEYLEEHPVLLAQFHAKSISTRPAILGKYGADFVILDSKGALCFIELERPNLQLFKADGHPTAKLMHAYGQVRDWLNEYSKHRAAVLDSLGIGSEDVKSAHGLVVAGRSSDARRNHLERHALAPPYPEIGFQTIDALADTLIAISRRLA